MNKLVLVTGSAKGIGASTVEVLAKKGYDVIINYKTSEQEAIALYEKIKNNYEVQIYVEQFDITNEVKVKHIFNKYKIDILINNASLSIDSKMEEIEKNNFMDVLKTNIFGTFLMSKEFIINNNKGIIINISSTDAIDTYNAFSIDYCASKAAILNITKNMADNYKSFKICAVCPNWVNTETVKNMNPDYLKEEMNRIGQQKLIQPDDVANKIYDIIINDKIKSGSIVRID